MTQEIAPALKQLAADLKAASELPLEDIAQLAPALLKASAALESVAEALAQEPANE
jgi:hypothetical protein